jgi:hypothetical protein
MFLIAVHTSMHAAAEGSSIGYGEGGYVPDFVSIVRRYNASGETFRIEGVCKSACTLFLGIRNVCVERSATLMFHAGHDIAENVTGSNTRASRAALYRYNDALRRYLLEGHIWTPTPSIACPEARLSIASATMSAPRNSEVTRPACAGTAKPFCRRFARHWRYGG